MEELILMQFWLSIVPLLVKGSQHLKSCDAQGPRAAFARQTADAETGQDPWQDSHSPYDIICQGNRMT